jgi:hypothetical protein
LRIDQYGGPTGKNLEAVFHLYPVPENPNLPTGTALFKGTFNYESRKAEFKGIRWITKPGSGWSIADFSGIFDETYRTFEGQKNCKGGKIELEKVLPPAYPGGIRG